MTTALITEWAVPMATAGPFGLAVDAGGNVYFAEQLTSAVARLDPRTHTFTEWPLPKGSVAPSVVVVHDRAVFFNEAHNRIGRFEPATSRLTLWDVSTAVGYPSISIFDIAVDAVRPPRLSVWCTMGADRMGRLDVNANIFQVFDLSSGRAPRAIAPDRSGIVWMGSEFPLIMRLDPGTRELRMYLNWPWPVFSPPAGGPVPAGGAFEMGMRVVDENTIMFTEPSPSKIGVLHAASNTITEWAVP